MGSFSRASQLPSVLYIVILNNLRIIDQAIAVAVGIEEAGNLTTLFFWLSVGVVLNAHVFPAFVGVVAIGVAGGAVEEGIGTGQG